MDYDFGTISSPTAIDCKEYYNQEKELVKQFIFDNNLDNKYYLTVIKVGEENESDSYIKGKMKDFVYIGSCIKVENINSKEPGYMNKTIETINKYNDDLNCAGLMIEIDRKLIKTSEQKMVWQSIFNLINPKIDIDGLGQKSSYISNTALGTINLLEKWMKIDLQGKTVTVIGRSKLVGQPIIGFLIQRGATVVCCNSKTPRYQLSDFISESDIIISATGVPNLINTDDFYFTEEYIVIDIGTTYMNGQLVGDLDIEQIEDSYGYEKFKLLYTSVPGGMGLVTRATILQQFINGIKYREEQRLTFKDFIAEGYNFELKLDDKNKFVLIPKAIDKNKEE